MSNVIKVQPATLHGIVGHWFEVEVQFLPNGTGRASSCCGCQGGGISRNERPECLTDAGFARHTLKFDFPRGSFSGTLIWRRLDEGYPVRRR